MPLRLRHVSRHLTAGLRRYSAAATGPMDSVVSCEWLSAELNKPRGGGDGPLRVVDASWFLMGKDFSGAERDATTEFQAGRIPGAAFFDLEQVADKSTGLAHMVPTESQFSQRMEQIGVDKGTRVVVYDALGVFSAPRCWFTFRTFGHARVAVLDGGFPAWKALGHEIETGEPSNYAGTAAAETWSKDTAAVWDLKSVVDNTTGGSPVLLVDARGAGRFHGTAPEPREGMRGGHVPGSISVPFMDLLNGFPAPGAQLKSNAELREVFELASVATDGSAQIATTCGSGMTAAIVGLALHRLGVGSALYDGSWSEYGCKCTSHLCLAACLGCWLAEFAAWSWAR